MKIHERNTQVIQELSGKFHGKEPNDSVQIFPISAGEYMSWIKKNKLRFDGQPTLSPTDTGIPKLRQTLMRYPADQNLKSYKEFVFVDLPYFIDKVKRVTTDTDRDIDFKNIADDFDNHRIKIIPKILDFAKKLYQNCTDTGMEHMRTQLARYKKQVDNMVNNQWTSKKGPTWNMILKFQGSIPPGASKAKGLEQGCDWCLDLSQVFASGFEKWHAAQKKEGADINRKLFGAFQTFHALYMNNMDRSSAGIQTTEKAKKHYQPHIDTVNAKLKCLAKRMTAKQGRLLRRATMEDRTQNSFIPGLTRPMFDEIFKAIPAIKSSEPGKKTKYVEPKVRFQKRRMMEIFIGEENHFVDKMLEEFALFVDSVMERLLEQTFKAIDDDFKQYSTYLRGRAPVNYEIDQKGYDIRVTLVEILPEAEKFVKELRQCFPKDIQDWKPAESENSDGATNDAEFSILFDRSTKRKVSITAGTVKEEAGTKRPCL